MLLAQMLAIVATAVLLALPTIALGRRSACPAAHPKHGAHACTGRAHHGRTRGKHARNGHRRGHHPAKPHGVAGKAPASAAATPATCEDGSPAAPASTGSQGCADGSEPTSEDGSSANDATCEDSAGNPCVEAPDEASDETDATCPEGTSPVPSPDGSSLLCERAE